MIMERLPFSTYMLHYALMHERRKGCNGWITVKRMQDLRHLLRQLMMTSSINQSISDLADHLNAMSASFQDIKEQDDCFLKIFLQSEVLSVWHLLQS